MDPEDRCIPNPAPPLLKISSPETHLFNSLTKIVTSVPPLSPWPQTANTKSVSAGGLFLGPSSIAYVFLNLTKTHPDLLIESKSPKYWCLAYLNCGQESRALEPAEWDSKPQRIGISCEFLAFRCIKAAITQDTQLAELVIKTIRETKVGDNENEHLRGRAGALSLLRMIKHWLPETAPYTDAAIKELIEIMLKNGNPWIWNNHRYLGAVHGDVGNLAQIILSDPSYAPKLEKKLLALLDMQLPSGGLPDREPSEGKRVWDAVQFCHGAPGFVLSLVPIRQYFGYSPEIQQRIDVAIEKARVLIWEKGILKKQPNLCHGVVGNAFALPKGEQREHFMAFATEEMMANHMKEGFYAESDDPWGLYWGEAGRAWGWMALACGIEGYPGYSDI